MSLQGTVLGLLLSSPDQEQKLLQMEQLKSQFFSGLYSSIYKSLQTFYENKSKVPSFDELKIFNSRNPTVLQSILAIEKVELPDVPITLQVDQLESEFIQSIAIDKLNKFADNLPVLSPQEIIDELQGIAIHLEENTQDSDRIFYGNEISLFDEEEETQQQFSTLGLSEQWDMEFLGGKEEEVILLGGHRGSGKSIMCVNICQHNLQIGKIAPYATIEMTAQETYQRFWQVLSGVKFSAIRNSTINPFEQCQLAMIQQARYKGGFEALMDQLKSMEDMPARKDYKQFEEYSKKHFEQILPIMVIDDRDLKISTLDLTLSTQKSKYGDLLSTLIVDYVNQLVIEGVKSLERLDWKIQTQLATMLKNLARKHKVLVISPYQVDENGATRLAKGLLDAVDQAFLLSKDGNTITLTAAKLRSLPAGLVFNSHIQWDYMRILPQSTIKTTSEDDSKDE